MKSMHNFPKSIFAVITALLFALAVSIAPIVYRSGGGVFLLLSARFISCALISFIFFPKVHTNINAIKKTELTLIFFVSLSFIIQSYGYMRSAEILPISIAITVFYTFPVITYLFEEMIILKKIKLKSLLWLLVALLGIWLLSQGGAIKWSLYGVMWALIAAVMQSCVNITSQRIKSVEGWGIVHYASLMPAITFALAYAFLSEKADFLEPVLWSILAAICFCFGLWLFFKSIQQIGSVRTSNILYLEPVFAFLLGMLIFNEYLVGYQYLGILLIVFSVGVIELGGRKKKIQLSDT